MRIIARKTLITWWTRHPETKPALEHWLHVTKGARWQTPQQVVATFPKAKVLSADRVRFEVAGGNYRLIAAFDFGRQIVFVKFIGTHADYDRIDALTVSMY